jgi:hypothetical protein
VAAGDGLATNVVADHVDSGEGGTVPGVATEAGPTEVLRRFLAYSF